MQSALDSNVEIRDAQPGLQAGTVPTATLYPAQPSQNIFEAAGGGKKREFVSIGERIHNEITYRGVDWILNAAFGVAFAFSTEHTAIGNKYWTKPVSGFYEKILSPVLKGEGLKFGTEWGTRLTSIMFGGTITIPPIMMLEDKKNKVGIIKGLDETIYGKETVANDPKFQKSYDEIKNEPEKNFSTGMITRFMALTPIFAIVLTKRLNEPFIDHLYDRIGNATKWLAEKTRLTPSAENAWWMEKEFKIERGVKEGEKWVEEKSRWDLLHRTIGFDFGLTLIYSVLHEISYKALAAMGGKKKQEQQAEAPATQPGNSDTLNSYSGNSLMTTQSLQHEGAPSSRIDLAGMSHSTLMPQEMSQQV